MNKLLLLLLVSANSIFSQCPTLLDPLLNEDCGPLTLDESQVDGFGLNNPQFYTDSQSNGGVLLPYGSLIFADGIVQLPDNSTNFLNQDFVKQGNLIIYLYDENTDLNCSDEKMISFNVKEEIRFPNRSTIDICPGDYSLSIDLLENAPENFGNGTFKWKATQENPRVNGISTTFKFSNTINDVLSYDGNSNNLIIYEVTPTSENGCLGKVFKISLLLTELPLVRQENIQFTECSETQLNLFLDNFVNKFGHNYIWSAQDNPNIEGESIIEQTTNRIEDILTNTSDANQDVIYTITPQNSRCIVPSFDITITIEKCSVLSTNDLSFDSFKIYPNPTNKYLNIQNLNYDFEFVIYDIFGKKIQEGINESKIDLGNKPNGLYILKLIDGKKEKEYKFIKN